MINRFFVELIGITLLFFLFGCKKENSTEINIQQVEIEMDVLRFDQKMKNSLNAQTLAEVAGEYPQFMEVYQREIMRAEPDSLLLWMTRFQEYADTTGITGFIDNRFGDISTLENDFLAMQKRLSVLFPDYQPLDLITMNSGFNFKHFIVEDAAAISLDMYLNEVLDYPLSLPNYYDYNAHTFTPGHILPELSNTLITDFYPPMPELNTFLDRILYNGKILYVQQLVLPDVPKHTLIGMTTENFEWCKQNEEQIYRYFVGNEMLYSNRFAEFKSYISEGPFSAGMPEASPGNTGSYIGWRIIQEYMKDKPTDQVNELLRNLNSQQILQEAKYSPKD